MRHTTWLRLLLAAVMAITAVTAAPRPTFAQEDKARAIELISEANEAYDAGNFRDALVRYREAYDITEDPRVLYRIGLTYENLANYQRAREHLELFLLAEPDSKYAGRVKSKIENLRKLEEKLQASIKVNSNPAGADVWVDDERGKPAGVTPVQLPVGPGTHSLVLKKEGFETVSIDVEVEAGSTVEKTLDLEGGGEAVATTDEGTTDGETEADETTEEQFTGQPSEVYIGPSGGVTALCWLAIGVGWLALIGAGGAEAATLGTTATRGGYVGVALMAVGGYFLWFHDWSERLPNARAGAETSPTASFFGMRFVFE
jgi:tetratricopeptide (TPR) repeat protein